MNASEMHELAEAAYALHRAMQRAGMLSGRDSPTELIFGVPTSRDPFSPRVGIVQDLGEAMGLKLRVVGVETEAERTRRAVEGHRSHYYQPLPYADEFPFRDPEGGILEAMRRESQRIFDTRKLAASFTVPSGPASPTPRTTSGQFDRRICPKCSGTGWPGCDLCGDTGSVFVEHDTGEVVCAINENPTGRRIVPTGWQVGAKPDVDPAADRHGSLHYKKNPAAVSGTFVAPKEVCDECRGSGTYESPLTGKKSPCSRGCRP